MDTKMYLEMMSDAPIIKHEKSVELSEQSKVILESTEYISVSDLLSEMKSSVAIDTSMINLIPIFNSPLKEETKELLVDAFTAMQTTHGLVSYTELLSNGYLKKARDYIKVILKSIEVYYQKAVLFMVKIINKAIMGIKTIDHIKNKLLEELEELDNPILPTIANDNTLVILFSSLGKIGYSCLIKKNTLNGWLDTDISLFYDVKPYLKDIDLDDICNICYTINNDLALEVAITYEDVEKGPGISLQIPLKKSISDEFIIDKIDEVGYKRIVNNLSTDTKAFKRLLDSNYNIITNAIDSEIESISTISNPETAVKYKKVLVDIIAISIRNIVLNANKLSASARAGKLIIKANRD